jgi:hypothetical protein
LLARVRELPPLSDAKIACARFMMGQGNEESLEMLNGIPLFAERMRGICEVALDITGDDLGTLDSSTSRTLRELTMMALEDWETCDFVISRWISLCKDKNVILKACLEMGSPVSSPPEKGPAAQSSLPTGKMPAVPSPLPPGERQGEGAR